jgi:hypothetical protein
MNIIKQYLRKINGKYQLLYLADDGNLYVPYNAMACLNPKNEFAKFILYTDKESEIERIIRESKVIEEKE